MERNELDLGYDTSSLQFNVEGIPHTTTDHKIIYNVSKGQVASVVSKDYRLVQHRELYDSVLEHFDNLGVQYEAKVKQHGHKMYLDLDFPKRQFKLTQVGEEFTTGLRVINSYDKSSGVIIVPKVKRLACMNGMMVSCLSETKQSIWHNSKELDKLGELISVKMNELINIVPTLQRYVDECMADGVEWKLVVELLEKFIKTEKHMDEIKKRIESPIPTRWEIYNAITNYATHGDQIKPTIEMWLQGKAMELLQTPILAVIERYKEVE